MSKVVSETAFLEVVEDGLSLDDIRFRGKKAPDTLVIYASRVFHRFVMRLDSSAKLSPYDEGIGYLERATYALTRHLKRRKCIHHSLGKAVKDLKYYNGDPRSPTLDGNPFHWMLVLIIPNGQLVSTSNGKSPISRQHRNRIAKCLLYADLHDVPTQYLVGFLLQTGDLAGISEKMKRGVHEPWLDLAE
jgi:hypothetical protein